MQIVCREELTKKTWHEGKRHPWLLHLPWCCPHVPAISSRCILLSWSLPLCCPHIEPLGVAFFAFTLKFSFFRSCGWFFPWCCPLSRLLVTLVCDRRLFSFNLRFRFGIRIEKWSGRIRMHGKKHARFIWHADLKCTCCRISSINSFLECLRASRLVLLDIEHAHSSLPDQLPLLIFKLGDYHPYYARRWRIQKTRIWCRRPMHGNLEMIDKQCWASNDFHFKCK